MNLLTVATIIVLTEGALTTDTEVVVLRAVRGREARLPCGQGRVFLDGPGAHVLWLKHDRSVLHRYPATESDRSSSQDHVFSSDCERDGCHDDTSLVLKSVSEQDGGIYRCRVHYQASPSVDYVIDLKLVDSPGTPRIMNGIGEVVQRSEIGPLSLGSELHLVCEVDNDQPDTLLYWRRNGRPIERAHSSAGGVLRAEVRVRNVTRDELGAHYECLARNADVSAPRAAGVLVRMTLPPLSVQIRLNDDPAFEAGQPRVADCVVLGCVPPPSVTWLLDDTPLRSSAHKELHEGNYTVSSLTLAPSLRDSRRRLVCRATNELLPAAAFEDGVVISVGFRPVCVSPWAQPVGAVEQQAESLSCVVDASPPPAQFSWTFSDSRTLYTGVKKVPGHLHRYASTLTWLPRAGEAGTLLCRATNSFGEQRRACSFAITPGGPPEAPLCQALRSHPDELTVQCKKAWDGGRPQTVHLELLSASGAVLLNASDAAGFFRLTEVAGNLSGRVYASSERGRSALRSVQLEGARETAAAAERESGDGPFPWPALALAAALATAATAAAAAVCFGAVRRGPREERDPDLVPRADGSFHREPDFAREERPPGTTNITVNQLASACPNQYSPSPLGSCRVLVGCSHPPAESTPAAQHSYYV